MLASKKRGKSARVADAIVVHWLTKGHQRHTNKPPSVVLSYAGIGPIRILQPRISSPGHEGTVTNNLAMTNTCNVRSLGAHLNVLAFDLYPRPPLASDCGPACWAEDIRSKRLLAGAACC